MIKRISFFLKSILNSKIPIITYVSIKRNRASEGKCLIDGTTFNYSNGNIFIALYEHIFLNPIYNFSEEKNQPFVILDCGANVGIATLYFKKYFPKSKVIAFEPDPKNFEILSKNIADNNISDVILSDKAIWINNDGVQFSNTNNLGSKIEDSATSNENLTKSKRLKDLINEYDKIGFLKLDIEGAESIVLEDCKEVLHKIDKMFIEYHSSPSEPQQLQDILTILTNEGFRYYIKEDCALTQNPYQKINPIWGYDLQLQIFAYK